MRAYQNNVIYLGETNYRGDRRLFGMYQKDKIYHTLITGKTGSGKSSILHSQIMQEIYLGVASVVVFDPNGDLIDHIGELFPGNRRNDLIIIDPANDQNQYGYNPLRKVRDEHKPLVVSGVIETFKRLYGLNNWGNRIEHILRHCLYLLLEQRSATLADIPKLLVDQEFRSKCRMRVNNEHIHNFWMHEFPKYRADALLPLLSKLSFIINHPAIRNTVVFPKQDISLRRSIDSRKIILVNLSKGRLGSDVSALIGSLLITSLSLAVYSRADKAAWERPYCSLYIDEFQNFTTTSLVSLFSEVRKYNLAVTVATQYLEALKPEIRDSVLGNISTLITFRVSYDESKVLAKYLYPTRPESLVQLPNYQFAAIIMINGTPSTPFLAKSVTFEKVFELKMIPASRQNSELV